MTGGHGLRANADFGRLWSGQTVSVFGSLVGQLALQFTAILWLDVSAAQLAILAGCHLIPGFVVSPFAGVWVDRLSRRDTMVAADLGRFLALATIPLAALAGALTVTHLFLVAFLMSTLNAVFEVAYRSILPEILSPSELVPGNARLTASESVAETVAFGSGGWLVQLITAPGAVAVDALSFAWSALRIGAIRRRTAPQQLASRTRPRIHADLRDGLRFVARQPYLRALAVVTLLIAFGSGVMGTVLLLYLSRDLGVAPGVLGLIFAVGGLTSLGGALFAERAGRIGAFGPMLVLSLAGLAVGEAFLPLVASVSAVGIALLVANQLVTDPCWTIFNIHELSLRQALTPPDTLGRMNGVIRTVDGAGRIAGTVAAGVLGDAVGLRETVVVAVVAFALAPISVAVSPVARLRIPPGGRAAVTDPDP